MGAAFIRTSDARRLRLVVVYPGVGYGTQDFVRGRLERVLKASKPGPALIVIAPRFDSSYSRLKSEIDQYAQANGLALDPDALVGWSGGSKGVGKALNAGAFFRRVLLADPSPAYEAGYSSPRTRMWYQPANWKGRYRHLGGQQQAVAQRMGNRAVLLSLDHNQILDHTLKEAFRQPGLMAPLSTFPTRWVIGVPVLVGVAFLIVGLLRRRVAS